MFKNIAFMFLCSAQLAPLYGAENEQKTFPAAGLTGMYIAAETGAIGVEGSAKGDVQVEITENDPEKCLLTMGAEGGRLVLKAEGRSVTQAKGWRNIFGVIKTDLVRANCPAGFKVSAPSSLGLEAKSGTGAVSVTGRDADVSLENGTGNITLSKVSGNIDVNSGTGDLTGEVCAKRLTVKGGTGAVELKGLCGAAQVETGTGAVDLRWARLPAAGEVSAVTGTSAISLVFPRKAKLSANLVSGTGSISNEFENSGVFRVSAQSGTGSISVKKAAD
ncbi:MAG: DUF4097 family beta strand repeat-containing protein [Elusimicrobiota bacterium]|nr:DUF4097 family beta strand repeat-containing protein [Elusimicrobiota bacterium]